MSRSSCRSILGSRTTSGTGVVCAVVFALLLLAFGRPVAAAPSPQAGGPTPPNLRCPGPGLVPVPPPAPAGWTPAYPIWEWRDLYSFESQNEPGHNSPVAVALGQDCTV